MATRIATRYFRRNFSSGRKVLGKEEQAAENVYIKKDEQEKLEQTTCKAMVELMKNQNNTNNEILTRLAKLEAKDKADDTPNLINRIPPIMVMMLVTALGIFVVEGYQSFKRHKKQEAILQVARSK